jgi:hypothetical protein
MSALPSPWFLTPSAAVTAPNLEDMSPKSVTLTRAHSDEELKTPPSEPERFAERLLSVDQSHIRVFIGGSERWANLSRHSLLGDRLGAAAVMIGANIYVFGKPLSQTQPLGEEQHDVYSFLSCVLSEGGGGLSPVCFNVESRVLRSLGADPTFKFAVRDASAVAVDSSPEAGSRVLLIGGSDSVSFATASVVCFDVTSERCSQQFPALLCARASCGAVRFGSLVIVCGGNDRRGQPLDTAEYLDLAQYDAQPITTRWTALPKLSQKRIGLRLAVFENEVWALGGQVGTRQLTVGPAASTPLNLPDTRGSCFTLEFCRSAFPRQLGRFLLAPGGTAPHESCRLLSARR